MSVNLMEAVMKQQTNSRAGIFLILLGIVAMTTQFLGISLFSFIPSLLGRFWTVIPLGIGALFMAVPLLNRDNRGLGGMFIPGAIITTNGLLLTASSVFGWWSLWSWAWPLQFLGLATGFTLAGMRLRVPELLIPASIMFVNFVLFQFSTITGWWHLWAFLWPLEIAAVALGLILVGAIKRNRGIRKGGLIVAQVSAVFMFLMLLVGATSYLSLATGALLVGTGVIMLGWNMMGRSLPAGPQPAAQTLSKETNPDFDLVLEERDISSPKSDS